MSFSTKDHSNIKILVGYHRPGILFKNDVLFPIHLGRTVAQSVSKDGSANSQSDLNWLQQNMVGDNTGDHISEKNRSFNEMTGLYWAWKNLEELGNPDYVGFTHYRRQFIFDDAFIKVIKNKIADKHKYAPGGNGSQYFIYQLSDDELKTMSDEVTIRREVGAYDLVTVKPVHYSMTVAQDHREGQPVLFVGEDIDMTLALIDQLTPEYSNAARQYLNGHENYSWNMFVMKQALFIEYCEWVFKILFALEGKIDISQRSLMKQRVFGYVAEKLTGIFITQLQLKKQYQMKEYFSVHLGYTDLPKKIQPFWEESTNYSPFVFASDSAHIAYLAVTLKSAIKAANSQCHYEFFVLDYEILDHHKKLINRLTLNYPNIKITFIDITVYLKNLSTTLLENEYFQIPLSFYKFFIPRIFDQFDKIIYIDKDVTLESDIAELYEVDISPYLLGACKDIHSVYCSLAPDTKDEFVKVLKKHQITSAEDLFQEGLLIMDLKQCRASNFEMHCLNYLEQKQDKRKKITSWEVLNAVYQKQVSFISYMWGYQWQLDFSHMKPQWVLPAHDYDEQRAAAKDVKAVHYAGKIKPWHAAKLPWASVFWTIAKETDFYEYFVLDNIPVFNQKYKMYKKTRKLYWKYKLLYKLLWGKIRKRYKNKARQTKQLLNQL